MNTQPALLVKEIERYQVMEFLGAGTFGQVFRARDLFLGRDVALKVSRADIASDPKSFKRFVKESRIQGRRGAREHRPYLRRDSA